MYITKTVYLQLAYLSIYLYSLYFSFSSLITLSTSPNTQGNIGAKGHEIRLHTYIIVASIPS